MAKIISSRLAREGSPALSGGWTVYSIPKPTGNEDVDDLVEEAGQGDAIAQYVLGWLHKTGHDVPQDYAEAMKWYRLAADQGYSRAQFDLGMMYSRGQGVPQDLIQAYTWLDLAVTGGHDIAIKHLGKLIEDMTPDQIAEAQKKEEPK